MADAVPSEPDRSMLVDGNRLTLLADGPERLSALIGLIDGAKATGATVKHPSKG